MTPEEMKAKTKQIKMWAKSIFNGYSPLPFGFSLSCITVLITSKTMTIVDFELSGKSKEGEFIWPLTSRDMLKKMIYHCGSDKVNTRLKNNISTV